MSTKRFSFTKGFITLVLMLVAVLGLVACQDPANPDQDTVDAALEQVALVFGEGDSLSKVTRNITLPTAVGEVTITWASSNAAVVSNTGAVVRPNADTVVSLTATLTLGEVSETKVFTLTVKAAEAAASPEEALAVLQIFSSTLVYNEGTGRYTTTTDLFLPTRSMKLDVTWTTPNAAVINTAGKVVRPAWGQPDQTVILVASIGEETREFIITVPAITVKPASISVQEAKDALLLAGISNGVAADLVLPTSVGTDGVTVTWSSNNPDVISNDGKVNRQQESVTVTLTATLTKGTVSDTKEFDVVVLPFAEFTEVSSIQAAKDLHIVNQGLSPKKDTYVKITGLTVVGVTTDGYMVYDGALLFFVYTGGAPAATIKAGDVYDITGFVDYYFGAWQFNGTKNAEMPTILKASTQAADVLDATAFPSTIVSYIETLAKSYTFPESFPYAYVEITAKIRVQGTGNYDVFLVDTDYTGGNIDSSQNSAMTLNAFVVYYKSNVAALREMDGLKVKLNVFLYSLRTDRNIFTVIFTGVKEDIEVLPMTDAELVSAAKSQSVANLPSVQETAATLVLPTDLLGTTIIWTSSNDALINPTTGVVTPVAGSQTAVTLTATITKGTVTDTATKVIKVGQVPLSTVAQVVAAEVNSTLYRVQGLVTAGESSGTFFIQQGEAGIAVYTTNTTLKATLTANVGKLVEVIGTRAVFNGLRQFAPTEIKAITGTAEVVAASIDGVAWTNEALLPYQGRLVTLSDLRVKTMIAPDKTGNVILERVVDGQTITLRLAATANISGAVKTAFEALKVGDIISVTAPLAWYNGAQFLMTNQTVIAADTLTDAVKVAGDKAALVVPAEVKANTTLSLVTAGANGSTISWATDNAAVITAAGVVTLPVSGQVTVKLTATITLGTLTETREFNVVVGLSDQDNVNADAAALVVVSAQTSATTIVLPATGANGSAIVWTSSNDALINPTTGAVVMPQSGQVVVTLTATLTLNAATKVQTFEVTLGTAASGEVLAYSLDFVTTPDLGTFTGTSYIRVFNINVVETVKGTPIAVDIANANKGTTGGAVADRLFFVGQSKTGITFDESLDGIGDGAAAGAGGLRFQVVSGTYTKIEFTFVYDSRTTNQNPATNIDSAKVQYWDGDSWELAKDFLTQIQTVVSGSNTLTITFDNSVTTTAFRLLVDEDSIANNGQVFQPTSLKIYSTGA